MSQLLRPGPIGHNPWNEKVALEAFIRALLAKQIKSRRRHGSKPVWGLPDEDLKPVADRKQMHKDVAPLFNKMWDEIVAAFKKRKDLAKGDSIGVASAYRSAETDNNKWYSYLPKYLRTTQQERMRTGEAFGLGPRSLEIVYRYMNGRKAPAGYSGHTHGIAADLRTTENGRSYTANADVGHQLGRKGRGCIRSADRQRCCSQPWIQASAGVLGPRPTTQPREWIPGASPVPEEILEMIPSEGIHFHHAEFE